MLVTQNTLTDGMAKRDFDRLGIRVSHAEYRNNVVRNSLTSYANHTHVAKDIILVNGHVRRSATDIHQSNTHFSFGFVEHCIGAGDRLQNDRIDMKTGALGAFIHVVDG
jgi:hypothetical protein